MLFIDIFMTCTIVLAYTLLHYYLLLLLHNDKYFCFVFAFNIPTAECAEVSRVLIELNKSHYFIMRNGKGRHVFAVLLNWK